MIAFGILVATIFLALK
ncbi:hypothetical protein [Phascolarctobacterium faecium]